MKVYGIINSIFALEIRPSCAAIVCQLISPEAWPLEMPFEAGTGSPAVCWQVCHSENGEWNWRRRKGGASPAWIAQWQSQSELGICSAFRGQRILRSTHSECRCELFSCAAAPGPKASACVTQRNMIQGHRFSNNGLLCGHVCVSSVWKLQWRVWVIWNAICQHLTHLCRFRDYLDFMVTNFLWKFVFKVNNHQENIQNCSNRLVLAVSYRQTEWCGDSLAYTKSPREEEKTAADDSDQWREESVPRAHPQLRHRSLRRQNRQRGFTVKGMENED